MIKKHIYKFSATFFILAFLLLTNPNHIFAEGINIQPAEIRANATFEVNVSGTTAGTCYGIWFKKDGAYIKGTKSCGPDDLPLETFAVNIYKTMVASGSGIQFRFLEGFPEGTYDYEIWKEQCVLGFCNWGNVVSGTFIISAGALVCGGPFDCPSNVCLSNGTCAPGGPPPPPAVCARSGLPCGIAVIDPPCPDGTAACSQFTCVFGSLGRGICTPPGGPAAPPFSGGSSGAMCWYYDGKYDPDAKKVLYTCKNGCTENPSGGYPFIGEADCNIAKSKLRPAPIPDPNKKSGSCSGNECKVGFGKNTNLTINVGTPTGFIEQLMKIILGIAGAITVIMIIIAGYTFMTSRGDKQKIAGARETLISAITGLLFIVFSLAILRFLGFDILGIPGFG